MYNEHNNYEEKANELNEKRRVKKSRDGFKGFVRIIASGLIFGLVAGIVFQGVNYISTNKTEYTTIGENIGELDDVSTDSKVDGGDNNNVPMSQTDDGSSGVSRVVANAMPSIVAINSTVTQSTQDFFGRSYSEDVKGSGSGIIIGQNDQEILIATNNHVISDTQNVAKKIEVIFVDDSTALATVKGTAPKSDLAVISVNINDLSKDTISSIKIATLGDSENIKLGEMAVAIGNALGYGQTITVGYISALNREITVEDITLNVLQTDAAINPGNSGGALLNSKGEVIGINSVKYVDTTVESVGYAIPISQAIPIINSLMNRVTLSDSQKAYLGVGGRDVSETDASRYKMPVGFYIGELTSGSAAEKAGVQVGDILVGVNDIEISSISDLQDVLSYTKAGSQGTLTVKRFENGEYVEKVLDITFDARPSTN